MTLTIKTAVHFTEQEIAVAKDLKANGLVWQPKPGHFALDDNKIIQRGSPFQAGVYFILNYEKFVSIAGGIDELVKAMTWLPTYEQGRERLRGLGVDNRQQSQWMSRHDAINKGTERLAIYRLLLESLSH